METVVWSSGAGLPIDTVSANGRGFIATGNGDLTSYPPLNNSVDFGESILRYDLSNGGFAIADAFTSFNQSGLTGSDLDQGSGGVLMLPDQGRDLYTRAWSRWARTARILVLNRDKLNGYAGSRRRVQYQCRAGYYRRAAAGLRLMEHALPTGTGMSICGLRETP